METILKIDEARGEVTVLEGCHTYKRAATKEELAKARDQRLDTMGSDFN